MGTPDFAVPSLKFIEKNYNIVAVYSQPARPSGRGMRTKLSPVEIALSTARDARRILVFGFGSCSTAPLSSSKTSFASVGPAEDSKPTSKF